MMRQLNQTYLAYLAVGLLALAIYAPGLWWGAPHATGSEHRRSWGIDDETPLGPLAEIHNIIEPKPDRNLGYPLMYSFIVAAGYVPYLGYLRLTGQLSVISGTYPFGLADPVGALKTLTYIAHSITVLMAAGIIVAAFDIGTTLWNRRTGLIAAVFAMLVYPMFYYARTGNVDVPVLFFIALAIAAFARSIEFGLTARRAALLGGFVGFAMGTKESALGAFLAMPFVLLAAQWRDLNKTAGWLSWSFWKAPLAGSIAAVLAFGIGSGLFVEPERYIAHVRFLAGNLDSISAGVSVPSKVFPYSWEGHIGLAAEIGRYLVAMLTWPCLILVALGLVWALWKEPKGAVLALLATTYAAYMFVIVRAAQMRYTMPLAFVLALLAARMTMVAWDSRRTVLRIGFLILAIGSIAPGMLKGVELTYQMINDSRWAAATWLAARTTPGDHIEYFGSSNILPPLESGVVAEPATEFRGIFARYPTDAAKAQEILQGWRQRQPRFIILMPDLTSPPGAPYNITCPSDLCEALLGGEFEYQLAAQFQTPPLFPWITLPPLDYPSVNPPIHIFAMANTDVASEAPDLD